MPVVYVREWIGEGPWLDWAPFVFLSGALVVSALGLWGLGAVEGLGWAARRAAVCCALGAVVFGVVVVWRVAWWWNTAYGLLLPRWASGVREGVWWLLAVMGVVGVDAAIALRRVGREVLFGEGRERTGAGAG